MMATESHSGRNREVLGGVQLQLEKARRARFGQTSERGRQIVDVSANSEEDHLRLEISPLYQPALSTTPGSMRIGGSLNQCGGSGGSAVSIPIPLRSDFEAATVRRIAKATKNAAQGRRLLALAEIYDGGTRTDAARIGGVGLQTLRDWVLAFNAEEPSTRNGRVASDARRRGSPGSSRAGPAKASTPHRDAGLRPDRRRGRAGLGEGARESP
jgi:hypothetical protein